MPGDILLRATRDFFFFGENVEAMLFAVDRGGGFLTMSSRKSFSFLKRSP